MNTQDTLFYMASIMATRKEHAIAEAINSYFKGFRWDEGHLEEYAGIDVDPDGTETFFIADTKLVKFGPLESKVDIEGERVILLFHQTILELY